ncbi:signal peptidase I [Paludifilum halophilum]|uniref:Signal peptidase I n=2 Tax=Paludifilum halophilum TaxID=1642702 RepID=A0A235B2D1_9BACL|nr:signal peptidase I [Paludifilum halophilum]
MIIIRVFLFAPYEVHGESMYPTFKGEELLIVNKWIYDVSDPDYGDIVVFHTAEHRDFIKRVIGLPGDKIAVQNGVVYRNGKKLDEPYISEPIKKNVGETVVPEGSLFVMGDNRNHSRDSRDIGPVDIGEVVGRADLLVMPIREFRLLFR